jgi:hypothetical protein
MYAFPRSRLALAALASTVAACGSGSSPDSPSSKGEVSLDGGSDGTSSAGSSPDGSPGAGGDAGQGSADAGHGVDAGHGTDGGHGTDAGSLLDAGTSEAGGSSADGGLAPYKGVANSACNDLVTLRTSWYYNWELTPPCSTPQFVPMVWGHTGAEQTLAGITSEVASVVSGGYDVVLGFNEPDNSSQSDLSETMAISLWPAFNNPAVRVGSPATQANTTGQAWFKSFMSDVNADTTGTLRVDFITAHWYGWNTGSCDAKAANLESYVNYLEGIPGNRPIWLTEWGCLNDSNPDEATVQAFFSGAIAMFAKHPRIERYAWYPWETNNELVTSADAPTSLGTVFAAAPASK